MIGNGTSETTGGTSDGHQRSRGARDRSVVGHRGGDGTGRVASRCAGGAGAGAGRGAGARVVLAARREERIRKLADELGDAVAVRCDVTDPEQVEVAVRTATDAFGRIDVLVTNAGQGLHAPRAEFKHHD